MKSDGDCGQRTAEAKQLSGERQRQKHQVRRGHQLESVLKRTQEEFSALRERYQQLRKDFQFNLSILDCQNKELEKYDAVFAKAMAAEYSSCNVQELLSKMDKDSWTKVVTQQRISCLEEELLQEKKDHFQVSEALKASKMICQKLQNRLRSKELEMTGVVEAKDQRIKALKDEVKWRKSEQRELEKDHSKKCEDLVQTLKEREAQLEAQCRAYNEQQRKAEERVVSLLENMDGLAVQARCAQEQQQRAVKQKDEIIQSYKQQLSAALIQERETEQVRVQKELEWQNCCEVIKAEHYLTNEQLIQDLTEARDQALANLKEKEREVKHLSALFHSVKAVRDQAIQVDSLESEEMRRVQEQNSALRAVVALMRRDMEGFGRLRVQTQAAPQASPQQVEHHLPSGDASIEPSAAALASTGEPAQAVELFNRSQEGDDCAGTKMVKHTHPPPNVLGKGASVQQLQENNRNLQPHISSAMSLGALGNIRPTESKRGVMYTRLKQAASCINRLSREKQKLIEMGNCLRAQIASDQPQGSVKPGTGLSEERPGNQTDWLPVLEKLQYQLTTQELQYASKKNAHNVTGRLLQQTSQQRPSTDGPVSTSRQRTTQALKNGEKTGALRWSQSQEQAAGASFLWSPEEPQHSLVEPWETLGDGLRTSQYSEGVCEFSRKEEAEPCGTNARMEESRTGQARRGVQQRTNASDSKQHGAGSRRIRNYNVKD